MIIIDRLAKLGYQLFDYLRKHVREICKEEKGKPVVDASRNVVRVLTNSLYTYVTIYSARFTLST